MIEHPVPQALHICPGCDDLTAGATYCEACRRLSAFYERTGQTMARCDADEEAGLPPAPTWRELTWLAWVLGLEAWAAAMTLAVRYLWQHWK